MLYNFIDTNLETIFYIYNLLRDYFLFMNTVIERLFYYFEKKGIKHTPVESELGLSNGYFGKMLKRNGSMGDEILQKIFSKFPELNIVWIMTGNGEMELSNKMAGKMAGNYKNEQLSVHEVKEYGSTSENLDTLEENIGVYKVINTQMVNLLLKETKELSQEIGALKHENAELRTKNANLQGEIEDLKGHVEKAV